MFHAKQRNRHKWNENLTFQVCFTEIITDNDSDVCMCLCGKGTCVEYDEHRSERRKKNKNTRWHSFARSVLEHLTMQRLQSLLPFPKNEKIWRLNTHIHTEQLLFQTQPIHSWVCQSVRVLATARFCQRLESVYVYCVLMIMNSCSSIPNFIPF